MRRGQEDGFVLIATLWFVALLALVTVIVAGWISRSMDVALAQQQSIGARADLIDAINETAYLMVGNYPSARGLELLSGDAFTAAATDPMAGVTPGNNPYIALDDRPYRLDNSVVELQDGAGLDNLSASDSTSLGALLKLYGVAYDDRSGFFDKLLDYTERSDTHRLNGAKVDDYLQAHRPPPRDAPLLTPWEAFRVLDWDRLQPMWNGKTPLPQISTVNGSFSVNANTAPAAVLATIPGMDADAVARVLHYRETRIITGPVDMQLAAGVKLQNEMGIFYFPGAQVRLTVVSDKSPIMHVIAITRTPNANVPVRIDYQVDLPINADGQAVLARNDVAIFPHKPPPKPPPPAPAAPSTIDIAR